MNAIQPISTCTAGDCRGCPVAPRVQCHFRLRDFTAFMLVSLPGFCLGVWGILLHADDLLIPWVVFCGVFFGVVMPRSLCSRCPRYAEPGAILRCWANLGVPKLFKYRPRPLSRIEKGLLLGGIALTWGIPLVVLAIAGDWLLLLGFSLASGAFYALLRRLFCTRCANFFCPLNRVPLELRARFWELNPGASGGNRLDST
jgi:hypothetical protein